MSVVRSPFRLAAVLAAVLLASVSLAAPARVQAAPQVTRVDCPPTVVDSSIWCGSVQAPAEPTRADAQETITVGFAYAPATGTSRGTVFVNPGGPGGDAYSFLDGAFSQLGHVPAELREHFDVVAVQPRGLPGSTPIVCPDDAAIDPFQAVTQPATLARTWCNSAEGDYLSTLTTENTVWDVEAVRQALGKDRIHLYGLSYGTYVMSAYASTFPQHTGNIVLDSAMNPDRAWQGIIADQQQPYVRQLHSLFSWIAAHDSNYHLGTTPYQVYEKWATVAVQQVGVPPAATPPPLTAADVAPAQQPLLPLLNAAAVQRVQLAAAGGNIVHGAPQPVIAPITVATREILPQQRFWPELALGIAASLGIATTDTHPTPTTPGLAEKVKENKDYFTQATVIAQIMQQTLMCNENTTPGDMLLYPQALWVNFVTQDVMDAPPLLARAGHTCAGTTPVTTPVAVHPERLPSKPLQIQGTLDPQTPWDQAMIVHQRLGTTLITVNSGNHGHVSSGNKEATRIAIDYLLTGKAEPRTIDAPAITP